MKYKDLDMKDVKKICKCQAEFKNNDIKFHCETCPLRRERIDSKGKTHNLFCYYVLMRFYMENITEWEELKNEDVQHEEEIKEILKKFDTTA